MPPSKWKAARAATRTRRHEVALHAQQATFEELQQQLNLLDQKGNLLTQNAISVLREKVNVQHSLNEQQIRTLLSQPMEPQSQIPALQAPSMPPTTPFQGSATQVSATNQLPITPSVPALMSRTKRLARERQARLPHVFVPAFEGDYRFDFGAWENAYLSKVPLNYIKTLAGQDQALQDRRGLLKALFQQKPQILFEINQPLYLRAQSQQEQTGLMSSSSMIASSSPPPIFSSSPSQQFDLASSPPSYSTEAPKWVQRINAPHKKFYKPMIASPRPVLTKAGPSTPAGNTRARVKTKVLRKGKGKAPYIKQEPLVSHRIIVLP